MQTTHSAYSFQAAEQWKILGKTGRQGTYWTQDKSAGKQIL